MWQKIDEEKDNQYLSNQTDYCSLISPTTFPLISSWSTLFHSYLGIILGHRTQTWMQVWTQIQTCLDSYNIDQIDYRRACTTNYSSKSARSSFTWSNSSYWEAMKVFMVDMQASSSLRNAQEVWSLDSSEKMVWSASATIPGASPSAPKTLAFFVGVLSSRDHSKLRPAMSRELLKNSGVVSTCSAWQQ